MNTLEYVKARKKLKCNEQPLKRDANYQDQLGRILSKVGDREKMEADKEELVIPPTENQDFIF